jgi:hypothetical protein
MRIRSLKPDRRVSLATWTRVVVEDVRSATFCALVSSIRIQAEHPVADDEDWVTGANGKPSTPRQISSTVYDAGHAQSAVTAWRTIFGRREARRGRRLDQTLRLDARSTALYIQITWGLRAPLCRWPLSTAARRNRCEGGSSRPGALAMSSSEKSVKIAFAARWPSAATICVRRLPAHGKDVTTRRDT